VWEKSKGVDERGAEGAEEFGGDRAQKAPRGGVLSGGSGEVHSEPRPSTKQQGGYLTPLWGQKLDEQGVAKLARGVQPPTPSTRTLCLSREY